MRSLIALFVTAGVLVAVAPELVKHLPPAPPKAPSATIEATPVPLTIWQEATYKAIDAAQKRAEVAGRQGDHIQVCVQGGIAIAGWLDLAGSLPPGSKEQREAEQAYATLTASKRSGCGF